MLIKFICFEEACFHVFISHFGLFKQVIEGRIEEVVRRGRRHKQLLDDIKEKRILDIERGSSRSHDQENSLWERVWKCKRRRVGGVGDDDQECVKA